MNSSDDYGKLSHRTLDGMIAGARVAVDDQKEHPMDFALWKGARPGEPAWDSPWGRGRPGWHIECTSMAMTYLGASLDIHGGGQDLIFPHHENEIAQSEASTGMKPFARYWVHNGLLMLGEDKMSKSLGNLVSVKEALEEYTPDCLRLYLLSSHYRSPLHYSEEGCAAMERSGERLRNALRPGNGGGGETLDPGQCEARFFEAMDDDLNTPRALAALYRPGPGDQPRPGRGTGHHRRPGHTAPSGRLTWSNLSGTGLFRRRPPGGQTIHRATAVNPGRAAAGQAVLPGRQYP